MNEKHSYEKHLAEKLQQLPPAGDVEHNWQQMKLLLDEDMPRGGGMRWRWIVGVITGLLIIGGWLAGSLLQNKSPAVATTAESAKNRATTSPEAPVSKPDLTAPGNPTDATTGKPAAADSPEEGGKILNMASAETPPVPGGSTKPANSKMTTSQPTASGVSGNSQPLTRVSGPEPADDNLSTNNISGKKTKTQTPQVKPADKQYGKTIHLTNKTPEAGKAVTEELNLQPAIVQSGLSYASAPAVVPSGDYKAFTQEELFPGSAVAKKTGRAKRVHNQKAIMVGLSLPLAFPLGDQKALSYNSNAVGNTLSDYLPSPHFQYHLNDRTYLQTELQVMSPQYIRPLLLYQQTTPLASSNYYIDHNVYAKKLYYFNVPVGIHHSPFKNFYLGTGLQFSSLLSGVALFEERKRSLSGSPDVLLSERYERFNGDSLSQRLGSNELRLMLEANYYFDRFTVGLRYNQAFSNYASFQVNSNSPYTFDKNKALQFYLRYNLWESRNRKLNNHSLLSLK